jgi:hypothetical protein
MDEIEYSSGVVDIETGPLCNGSNSCHFNNHVHNKLNWNWQFFHSLLQCYLSYQSHTFVKLKI